MKASEHYLFDIETYEWLDSRVSSFGMTCLSVKTMHFPKPHFFFLVPELIKTEVVRTEGGEGLNPRCLFIEISTLPPFNLSLCSLSYQLPFSAFLVGNHHLVL